MCRSFVTHSKLPIPADTAAELGRRKFRARTEVDHGTIRVQAPAHGGGVVSILSTALKNTRIDLVKIVTDPLPTPARYLIEDVLRGVINPNILHDELQINDARTQCVRSILSPV